MKYLKHFEASQKASNFKYRKNDLIPSIEDIVSDIDLHESTPQGMQYSVSSENDNYTKIVVKIKCVNGFKYECAENTILQINNYMEYEGFKLKDVDIFSTMGFDRIIPNYGIIKGQPLEYILNGINLNFEMSVN